MTSIEDFTSQYGLVQKIDAFGYLDYLKSNPDAPRKHGKVVLVTADTPLKASRGEGKTTTTIALIDALRERGIDAAAVLRQPSMGITAAGSKGGASGGGKASLTHPELIDWGLCGEMGAIEAAQNLLVSFAEKAVDDGKLDTILVPRVSEVPSRSLRQIAVDRGKGDVAERVVLTPTCELMQIVVLSRSMDEISERVAKMVAGTKDGKAVTFGEFVDLWRITGILGDAVKPAKTETVNGSPVYVHGGPFANIAHGCNSVLATQMALTYGDYVITEAGFGADLGAEKFFNIKCRKAGLSPKLTVIVATAQSLKLHGGVPEAQIKEPNKEGLIRGFANLDKHIENMKNFGQQVIVTFNRFASDTDEEIALVAEHCKEKGVGFAVNTVFADGGKGAVELARLVAETIEKNTSKPLKFTYEESDSIRKKVRKIAEGIYGASSIVYTTLAEKKLKEIEKLGIAHFPVCIAKTQYSFSSDPKAYGVAKDFELKVRDIIINNGAEMIVVVMGEIMRMPGLPKEPQARHIDIVNGLIEGLS